ncbi:hypothetical protein ACFU5O_15595 [Streptomyces sp. NPDC057445]|uniref:hypothetical protein n=1 Tax=Streptomyces sp. NPDC057445 TaxID=3346136 RepID=UPI00368BE80E
MSEVIVVHEFDKPVPAPGPAGTSTSGARRVRRVHAAPAAPGNPSVPGPRTVCGKDTFAMEATVRRPSEHPGRSWYDPAYADRICADCDLAMGT